MPGECVTIYDVFTRDEANRDKSKSINLWNEYVENKIHASASYRGGSNYMSRQPWMTNNYDPERTPYEDLNAAILESAWTELRERLWAVIMKKHGESERKIKRACTPDVTYSTSWRRKGRVLDEGDAWPWDEDWLWTHENSPVEFFMSDMFAMLAPNIDGEWVINKAIDICKERERREYTN